MIPSKLFKPTTYLVVFWNEYGSEKTKVEMYPMHLYSLEEVTSKLKGKESNCDIYECRYWKDRAQYITVGKTIIWNGCNWVIQP